MKPVTQKLPFRKPQARSNESGVSVLRDRTGQLAHGKSPKLATEFSLAAWSALSAPVRSADRPERRLLKRRRNASLAETPIRNIL